MEIIQYTGIQNFTAQVRYVVPFVSSERKVLLFLG